MSSGIIYIPSSLYSFSRLHLKKGPNLPAYFVQKFQLYWSKGTLQTDLDMATGPSKQANEA